MITLTSEPLSFRAGDSIAWRKTFSDYPASIYTLSYRFINGASVFDVSASEDGDSFLVQISSVVSATYAPGDYTWFSFLTENGNRTTFEQGVVTILGDPATATEWRSPMRQALDALTEAIRVYGSRAYTFEYQIQNRIMRFKSNDEFMKYYQFLKSEVRGEDEKNAMAAGKPNPRRKGIQFQRAQ